jgi:uncharacterized membrane protein HdeD (DUF308 family)
MNRLLAQSWGMLALRGVLALLFGILALTWPEKTLLLLVGLFAAFALLTGAAAVVSAIRHRGTERGWWLPLLLGLVSIVAGVVALLSPAVTIFVLVMIMAAHALITGLLDIVMAFRLRKEIEREWLLALTGAVAVVFGVVVFIFPPAGALALAFMVGFYATLTGLLLLALAFQARKWARHPGASDNFPGPSGQPRGT